MFFSLQPINQTLFCTRLLLGKKTERDKTFEEMYEVVVGESHLETYTDFMSSFFFIMF